MHFHKCIRLAVAGAVLLVAGCDKLIEPQIKPPEPQYSGTPIQIADLPVPPTNWHTPDLSFSTYGSLPWRPIGELPAGKWAVIRIQGSIAIEKNPELPACDPGLDPPLAGMSAGPLGINTGLRVGLHRPGYGIGLAADGDSGGAVSGPLFSPWDATVYAGRGGLVGARDNCPGGQVPYYALSGTQTATIELIAQPENKATRTVLPEPATVRFVARNIPSTDFSPLWIFMPNDTLATPGGRPGWPTYYQPCNWQMVCDYPVSQSGRLHYEIANGIGGRAGYASDIVWVGKSLSALLTLNCTVTHVVPGGSTTCTAGTAPNGQPLEIHEWFFVLDAPDNPRYSVLDVCQPANPCTFEVPGEGRIVVRATVGGAIQVAGVQLALNHDPVDPPPLRLETDTDDGVIVTGTTVAFTAVADGAQSLQVQQWSWRAFAPPGQSGTCLGTPNPCVRPILENGEMTVRASVDAHLQRASAVITAGNVCLPNDPISCTGLAEAIQTLRDHANSLCRIVGETANHLYDSGWILSSDNFAFGGYQFVWPSGPGVLLDAGYFGSHDLLRILVHEVAHSFGAVHASRAAPGEYTTEQFESQCA